MRLGRELYFLVLIAAAIFSVSAPIYVSIYMAKKLGLEIESRRVLGYARDVVNRSETTATQVDRSIAKLLATEKSDPCSAQHLDVMSSLDLSSSYIQALGYVHNNEMICSSLKNTQSPLLLGPVDYVSSRGVRVRINVSFPFSSGSKFTIVEKKKYAAILNKELFIDATADEDDRTLGLFNFNSHKFISHRGQVKEEWIPAQQSPNELTFHDGDYVVAVVLSRRYEFGAIAALPKKYVEQKTADLLTVIFPLGITVSILMAIIISFLAYKQRSLPSAIRSGLKRKEFFLEYQPVVELKTRRWIGAEVLIRWRRSNGKLISPGLFIPIAEANGIIHHITEYVLKTLMDEASGFFARYPGFHIGINFSAVDLESNRSLRLANKTAHRMRAQPGDLVIEATERGFLNKSITRSVLHELRQAGISIAIDDFGTGYSSLSYLSSFELDYLKIDKSFIDALGTDAVTRDVVHCIIEMAKSLQLQMIAEGVETEAQAKYLIEHGVQYAQGWLFARSMSLKELEQNLRSGSDSE